MNKWTKNIEDCLAASIEHGPDAMFMCNEDGNDYMIATVMLHPTLHWIYLPPKPDIEQWGNEYALQHVPNYPGQETIYWHSSIDNANGADLGNDDERTALHHRIVDGETGKTKLFETLSVLI